MYDNKALFDELSELKVIDSDKLNSAFVEAQESSVSLGKILLDKDLILEDDLAKALASCYKVPFIDLSGQNIQTDILFTIPEIIAREQGIIAFKKDQFGLHVATGDPGNKDIIEFLQNKIGLPIIVYIATNRSISQALTLYLKDIGKAFEDIMQESIDEAKGKNLKDDDLPIVKIVETIISYAYQNNASDIHIEPEKEKALVRFRIDGVLHDIVTFSSEIYPEIVTRIKVLAKLRTDEHMVPQDGKIEFLTDNENLDIRVSIVPVQHGEKGVLRLLSERARQISLHSLGFSEKDLAKITASYQKSYGMILATGPTGCGKTTTMYAILKMLNNRDVNIMTIEDPIEYDIEGLNQIQVDTKTGLTFATGLRSILRQDPNIILVGEVRDEETAAIAVSSSMTGHLVLSTLHTNDAITAIPRLIDMKVESFLIASTVNVIIAQRLVRKICEPCRVSEEISLEKVKEMMGKDFDQEHFEEGAPLRIYKGKGCDVCHNTGYGGRMGIFEVLELNDEVKQAILDQKAPEVIKSLAVKNGMTTMIQDGINKVKEGHTTLEEILRVIKS